MSIWHNDTNIAKEEHLYSGFLRYCHFHGSSAVLTRVYSHDLAEGRPIEKDDLDVIAHEAERLGSLASELLDYSKLKAGAVEPNLAEFDASAAFGASAALFAPICERAGIRLDMQIEPNMHVGMLK